MLNVDGWTDGRTDERTNGQKLARLCLPAKAGATKRGGGGGGGGGGNDVILVTPRYKIDSLSSSPLF